MVGSQGVVVVASSSGVLGRQGAVAAASGTVVDATQLIGCSSC